MSKNHLSYRQFKNIFGDLGLTSWVKYNWLSNGFPDGVYNGITKVTISDISKWSKLPNDRLMYSIVVANPIPSFNTDTPWRYGFSNYSVCARYPVRDTGDIAVGVDNSGILFISTGRYTFDEVIEYISKHPINVYYYNRSAWGGYTITGMTHSPNNYYIPAASLPFTLTQNMEIKDVSGLYETIITNNPEALYADTSKDLLILNELNRALSIVDRKYPHRQDFIDNRLPRAIVYTLSSEQALLLAPQSLDEDLEE